MNKDFLGNHHDRIAVEIAHQPVQIGHPALDALRGVQRIGHAEPFGRIRDQLHQPLRPGR